MSCFTALRCLCFASAPSRAEDADYRGSIQVRESPCGTHAPHADNNVVALTAGAACLEQPTAGVLHDRFGQWRELRLPLLHLRFWRSLPDGAPSAPDTQVLTVQVWWDNLLEEVRSAMQVVMASYVYDNAALTDLLVRRMADRSAFDLTVLVDKERFEERECRGERPSLQRLQRAGAEVFLCRGYVPLKSREG